MPPTEVPEGILLLNVAREARQWGALRGTGQVSPAGIHLPCLRGYHAYVQDELEWARVFLLIAWNRTIQFTPEKGKEVHGAVLALLNAVPFNCYVAGIK